VYLADTQTNKQTKSGKNITSLAEVINMVAHATSSWNEVFRNTRVSENYWTNETDSDVNFQLII